MGSCSKQEKISLHFFVPGVPVAQPRQRHRIYSSRGKTIAGNYTPAAHPVNAYKAAIGLVARSEHSGPKLSGPLRIYIEAVFPRPQYKIRKAPNHREPKTTKPDLDNVAKAVMDALSDIWDDDAQIAALVAIKDLAGDGEEAGTWILIESI